MKPFIIEKTQIFVLNKKMIKKKKSGSSGSSGGIFAEIIQQEKKKRKIKRQLEKLDFLHDDYDPLGPK